MPTLAAVLGRRVLHTVPTLLAVTVLVFALLRIVPGDPLAGVLPPDASLEDRLRVTHDLGLDQPLPVQYVRWAGDALQGDFGFSLTLRSEVGPLVADGLRNTLRLAVPAAVLVFVLGVTIGAAAAWRGTHWSSSAISSVGLLGSSIPAYWMGMVFVVVFAVLFRWLPASGMNTVGSESAADDARHMVLPVIAIALGPLGVMVRMTRSSVVDILNQEFVVALRARGVEGPRLVTHVLRGAAPAILTLFGLLMGQLLSGSVLVETVFSWPGLGTLTYQAILQRDLQTALAAVLVVAVLFMLFNLLADVCRAAIDPRLHPAA